MTLAIAGRGAVWLEGTPADPAIPLWVWLAALGAAAIGVGLVVSYFAWRDAQLHTPLERAFRRTARRLRLRRAERIAVHRLGVEAGVAPVSLLVSRAAFEAARSAHGNARSLERAESRLFDEPVR